MKHREKVRLARRLEGKHRKGYSIFASFLWLKRKLQINKRVEKREGVKKNGRTSR